MLFDLDERKRAAELFLACRGQLQVAVHCGAQSTADTVLLAEHAAEAGADAVAVIAPPYYAFDADELLSHFREAAQACDPLPFYVYEFAARSGYPVPLPVIATLRDEASNFTGLKVSDTPWERRVPPRAARGGRRRRRRSRRASGRLDGPRHGWRAATVLDAGGGRARAREHRLPRRARATALPSGRLSLSRDDGGRSRRAR